MIHQTISQVMSAFIEDFCQGQPNSGHDILEAARYPQRCNANPQAMLTLIGSAIEHLKGHHNALLVEQDRLRGLNPIQATPHFRKDKDGNPKYLYLIHPTQANGERKREYIGADPDAQAAALARLQAHDDLIQVQGLIETAIEHIRAIKENLARAVLASVRGPVPPTW